MKKSIKPQRIVVPVKLTSSSLFNNRSDAQKFLHHSGAGVHKPQKGKGSYRRKTKHRLDLYI